MVVLCGLLPLFAGVVVGWNVKVCVGGTVCYATLMFG